jgi:acyl-CoA thioesterase
VTFSSATSIEPAGNQRWSAAIHPGWDIAGNANGGYLIALGARAVAAATGRPDPVSITAHFLAPGRPGPVEIHTRVLRTGRRFATALATVSDGERPLLAVLGSFADLGQGSEPGPERVDASPPSLPPPEVCVKVEPTESWPPPFMGRVDLRLHPEDAFMDGRPSGMPRVRGWFRLAEEEPIDTLGLLVAVDAFPPTIFNAALPVSWTPTIELTAHVRARPAPGWLRCAFTTRFITGGFLEEDGEVWDATGRLVAQSRQLALLGRG